MPHQLYEFTAWHQQSKSQDSISLY